MVKMKWITHEKNHEITLLLFKKNVLSKQLLVSKSKVGSLEDTIQHSGFQDPATAVMEGMLNLHHDLMFFMLLIVIYVGWLMYRTVFFFDWKNNPVWFYSTSNDTQYPSNVQHNSALEIIWTIIPCIMLIFISVPSFCLLYAVDDCKVPWWSVKAIGNQWFWTYEINSNLLVNSLASFERHDEV